MKNAKGGIWSVCACAFVLVTASAGTAHAVNLTVTNSTQLAQAFATANAHPSESYVALLKPTLYHLSAPLKLTAGSLQLRGNNGTLWGDPSATIITGDSARQVIIVEPSAGAYPILTVYSVSINDGRTEGEGAGIAIWGGEVHIRGCNVQNNESTKPGSGIFVQSGYLDLATTSVIANYNVNLTTGGGQMSVGGGIYFGSGATGNVTYSSIVQNKAIEGAGIAIEGGSQVWLLNSTIGENRASGPGGGIYLASNAMLNSQFNTIANNVAGDEPSVGEAAYGGGLALDGYTGSLTMVGTILADNRTNIPQDVAGYDGDNCLENPAHPSSFTPSVQSNMISKLENCAQLAPSAGWPNIGYGTSTVHANLSALAYTPTAGGNYVGPFYTPFYYSTVIQGYSRYSSAGNSTISCPPADQRLYGRLSTDRCDIGAVDYSGFP